MGKRKTFIISRADAIGDVVLTLPVAGVLRSMFPDCRVVWLGRSYTRAVIRACEHVDEFLDWGDLQKLPASDAVKALAAVNADTILHVLPKKEIAQLAVRAGIPERIGTTNRLFHWGTINRMVALGRRRSPYHEAQLNLRLLRPLGAKSLYSLEEIPQYYGLTKVEPLAAATRALLDPARFNLIFHPKSRGNGREWGLDNFIDLAALLPKDRFSIFVTGTAAEREQLQPLFDAHPGLRDMTGKLSLDQFIAFIKSADGLLASGTGPLHMAAALGIHALGIFPPIRPIHPGRWAPLGPHARFFVKDKPCSDCRKTADCACMRGISPLEVGTVLQSLK